MAIHSTSAHTSDPLHASSGPNSYFYNYFSLGLDFFLHPETHKVLKIVLHANTPGEVEFGRYGKCRWRLRREGREGTVSSESTVCLRKLPALQLHLLQSQPPRGGRKADISDTESCRSLKSLHIWPVQIRKRRPKDNRAQEAGSGSSAACSWTAGPTRVASSSLTARPVRASLRCLQ